MLNTTIADYIKILESQGYVMKHERSYPVTVVFLAGHELNICYGVGHYCGNKGREDFDYEDIRYVKDKSGLPLMAYLTNTCELAIYKEHELISCDGWVGHEFVGDKIRALEEKYESRS